MAHKKLQLNASCIHLGELEDPIYKGAVSPLYMSSSYAYQDLAIRRYPRSFNTPNQEALAIKIAGLENCEAGLIFGSGMAAISTSMLTYLSAGDHVVLQNAIYGGTYNFVTEDFERYGIEYSFTKGLSPDDFKSEIKENTKLLYIETPSNPLLAITDLKAVAKIAKEAGIVSMIDNTFASPVNQNPADFGIDVIIHSATKYMGGHSDICAGAVAASQEHINKIVRLAKNLGGSLSDYTVWLLERSIKTMGIRVHAHNSNALEMALFLESHPKITKVYYPGLPSHPGHALAASQMKGFGGMLSFELSEAVDVNLFQKSLKLIKPSMSLAGIESTLLLPSLTSHSGMGAVERAKQGIAENLIRFSVGIEEAIHLKEDLEQAILASLK